MISPIIKTKEYILEFLSIAGAINKSMNFKFIDIQNRCIICNNNDKKTHIFIRQFDDLQIEMKFHMSEINKNLKNLYSEIRKFNDLEIKNPTEEIITQNINNEKKIIIDMKNKLKIHNMKICCDNYIDKIKKLIKKEDFLNEKINIISTYISKKNQESEKSFFENSYNNIKSEMNTITFYFLLDMNIYLNSLHD
jgi:hypothetical protein